MVYCTNNIAVEKSVTSNRCLSSYYKLSYGQLHLEYNNYIHAYCDYHDVITKVRSMYMCPELVGNYYRSTSRISVMDSDGMSYDNNGCVRRRTSYYWVDNGV